MMDKTTGIKKELEKMIANDEIHKVNLEEVKKIIEYLEYNNIFPFERKETLDNLSQAIVDVLAEARQRYLSRKQLY